MYGHACNTIKILRGLVSHDLVINIITRIANSIVIFSNIYLYLEHMFMIEI